MSCGMFRTEEDFKGITNEMKSSTANDAVTLAG